VAERWAQAAVAGRFLEVLRGHAPAEWWFEPTAIVHAGGAGMAEEEVASAIRAVVEAAGAAALQVGDKPDLERRLVQLASSPGEAVPR
jgi:hypothetical protein